VSIRKPWRFAGRNPFAWFSLEILRLTNSANRGSGESGIPLTEACMDQSNAIRRYKLPACQSFEFDQCVLSFIDTARNSRDESPCRNRDRTFGELLFNVLKFGEFSEQRPR
jgi:hypothetical protein